MNKVRFLSKIVFVASLLAGIGKQSAPQNETTEAQ